MPVRLALAGVGIHGARYARHLLAGEVPGARLVAICRRDQAAGREFATRHGLRFEPDFRKLATAEDVDGVVVVLRPDLHAEAAEACLRQRCPVLVEKPMAVTETEARRLVDLSRETGTALMVGQTLRFDPLIEALKREADSVGELRLITVNQRFEPATRGWLDDPGPGGILLNTAVHGFDLLRYMTGSEPTSMMAEVSRTTTRRTDDQLVACLKMDPGNVLAVLDNARSTHSRSGRIEVVGSEAQVWGDHVHRSLTRVRGRQAVELGPVPAEATLPRLLEAFARVVRDGVAPPIGPEDGLATVRMVAAARESAATGRRVLLA